MATDATRADAARVEAAAASATRRAPEPVRAQGPGARRAEAGAKAARELAATLGSNPLPDAVIVELTPGDAPAAERLAAELRQLPKVALVQLDALWLQRLDALLRLGAAAVALLAGLLAVGMIAVTFNTVRLQIVTRQAEIEVSRLIGATASYIRRPFVWQGTVIGLAGGLVALGLVAGCVHVAERRGRPARGDLRLRVQAGPAACGRSRLVPRLRGRAGLGRRLFISEQTLTGIRPR